ncbi:MAG: hypothetical protein KC501_08975 [Myxococcales bacterium]|nr:hypothetical protein [Myxococcales bacterium]
MAGRQPALLGLVSILACADPPASDLAPAPGDEEHAEPDDPDPRRQAVEQLSRWEDERRAATDFAAEAPWSERSGADPFALRRLPDGTFVGLLRGAAELVRLDARGRRLAHGSTLHDATDLELVDDELLVVSPRGPDVARSSIPADPSVAPRDLGGFEVLGATSLRTIAAGPGRRLAVGDGFAHRVMLVDLPPEDHAVEPLWSADCAGPLDLRFAAGRLVALCMLEHAVKAWTLDDDGLPRGEPVHIEHDGPIWSMDLRPLPGPASEGRPDLRLVLGGVEDHPLDRSDGAFGTIDSFAFVVDLVAQGEPVRRAALNLGEHGAITPKWVRLRLDDDGGTELQAIGSGSEALVSARWDAGFGEPSVTTRALVPGITDAWISDDGRSGLAADPLLDAWVAWDGEALELQARPDDRPSELRLGEALALTGLMAQRGRSEGRRSRFTCETCHFEGGTDGRTHFTGRGQVHATTRPLRGLFPNRPHFSRALDRTMATMVDNEFEVVSRGTEGEPWFTISPDQPEHAWLRHLGVEGPVEPAAQRRALMTFLMAYAPEPNPAAVVHPREDDAPLRRGAALFEQHCERCHAARLVTDDPSSRVEPERWLELVGRGGPIVWASAERMRTGVEPYVHEQGARVPSLRRLHGKRPYLTNGSAATLDEVLRRFTPDDGMHDGGAGQPLGEDEREMLRAFVERL